MCYTTHVNVIQAKLYFSPKGDVTVHILYFLVDLKKFTKKISKKYYNKEDFLIAA